MPHAALCVSGHNSSNPTVWIRSFQYRTRHYVCRDAKMQIGAGADYAFQCRTRHSLCVSGRGYLQEYLQAQPVSMPHAALCVSGQDRKG